jgi:hypothetical protein
MVTMIGGHAALRPDTSPPSPHRRALWFGLFGAPAAWAVQLISNYALLAHFCFPTTTPLSAPTFGGTRAVAIVVTAVLLIVAIVALLTSLRSARMTGETDATDAGPGRVRFMARASVLVSGIFVYGILMAALPLISMRPCTL